MNTRRRFLATAAATFALLLGMIAPSYASGSFTWTATFSCCIQSRNWYQNSGSTTIVSYAQCEPNMSGVYFIELYKDELLDKSYGQTTYACGLTQQYTWTGLPSGYYYFYMHKVNDGISINANGSVTYP